MMQPSSEVPTDVLCLLNMVTGDELQDEEEYEGQYHTNQSNKHNEGFCLCHVFYYFNFVFRHLGRCA